MKWFNITLNDPFHPHDFGDVYAETVDQAIEIIINRVTYELAMKNIGFNPEPLRLSLVIKELDE